ncbi:MAG: hypothetical protein OSJ61_27835, partial [Lachnospiraceae bacterium]|nr:hypothetical protein [Lachnospiraceae bacterium]
AADGSGVISGLAGIGWGSIPALLFGDAGEDFRNSFAKIDRDRLLGSEGKPVINRLPDNESIIGHIFRDAEGHILDTPENRVLLEDVANNAENFRGIDQYGNEWYTKVLEDGKEVWVELRNGSIFEGGINESPRPWSPNTGLKRE